ncbi:hypothetical protein EDD85DRAFT_958623 [Armillaria nabsnona]|nr:hypothetical protein EDD85DRAFT_958623 [Armillaria nabsnona]
MKSEAHWSLFCTVDVKTRVSNDIQGAAALKIFQASLLPFESRSSPSLSLALSLKQLAGCENDAYDKLSDLQGTVSAYYYGNHKLATQHGEVAHVLVFAHIVGISLEGWIDSYPEHSDTDEPRNNLPFYNTMPSHFKAVTKLALHGITEINKRGILHGDISVQCMFITPTADNPTHVVFIDFARCNIYLTEAS